MLVGANHRTIDQQPFQVRILEFSEQPFPNPFPGPAVESPPHAVPVAEALGQVPPGSAGFRDPEDRVDEQAIILGCDPGVAFLARQKILNSIPIVIGDLVTPHDRPSLANEVLG
jgi:hypothetical protein